MDALISTPYFPHLTMKKTSLFSLVAALLIAPAGYGSGVNWSSPYWDQLFNGMQMVDAGGNPLDATFAFELGTFDAGFTPTGGNTDQWASHWNLLNRADTTNGNWVPNDPDFGSYFNGGFSFDPSGQVNGLAGSATFATGQQAYVWVLCDNEWALVTDNTPGVDGNDIWQLPNPTDVGGFPLNWDLANANVAVLGSVNNGTYRLQTAVVPEPSTSLLVLMLGGLLQLTRHKRRLAKV